MLLPLGSAGRRVAEERLADRRRGAKRPEGSPLVWVALATALGGAGAIVFPPIDLLLAGLLVAIGLIGWGACWRRRHDTPACGIVLGSIAILAALWASLCWHAFPANDLGRFTTHDSEPVCFEGIATSEPTIYAAEEWSPFQAIPPTDRTVLELRVVALRDATSWRDASGGCEVTVAGRLVAIEPGDRLRVFGQLRRPSQSVNPGQRDAAKQERAERRLALVWSGAPDCVTRIDSGVGNRLGRTAAVARGWAVRQVDERLGEEAAPLVRAMLLGDGSALNTATVDAFRRTGIVHVLVVSGLHVGLVAALLPGLAALGLLPRRPAWIGALILVGVYVAIAGARPPAVRAGVVAAAVCLAALAGRKPLSANSLAGAGVAVFAISPAAWISVGTQLSFVAAATLLGVASWNGKRNARVTPPLERLIQATRSLPKRIVRRGIVWGTWVLAATIAVQLVGGPLVASEFHLISPAAAPLALVVSPLIALTVGAGVFLLAFDAIGLTWLASLAGTTSGVAAEALSQSVTTAAEFPFASIWTAGPARWWALAWIGWVGISAAVDTYRWPIHGLVWRGGLALVSAAFVPTLWEVATERESLKCSFVAVGHGSATLLEIPGGGTILVDAGALGAPERVSDIVSGVLWSRGITRIDAIVLTHADIDHYNAVPGLLERFTIGAVWTSPRMFSPFDRPADRSGPESLKRLLRGAGVPIRIVHQGDRLRAGAARLEILHPDEVGVVGSDNANSLVVGVEFAGRRVLLPGDLESPGIEAVLAQEPYDCDVLLAPHHGSHRSNLPGFAAWCQPEVVLVSSGEDRQRAIDAYADSGAEVVSTHEAGLISIAISAESVRVAE